MKVKAFEIRDKGTFIPAIGILMEPAFEEGALLPPVLKEQREAERFLLRRAGFSCEHEEGCPRDVILCRMEASGLVRTATYDQFAWGDRTFFTAHKYIREHWDEIQSGAVICVEHILGERERPKQSERTT